MTDWKFAQRDPQDQLSHLHYFSMMKKYGSQEVEIIITVHEYISPRDPSMPFFAQGDKEMNQRTGALKPFGWGRTLLEALGNCVDQVRRFPYEPAA